MLFTCSLGHPSDMLKSRIFLNFGVPVLYILFYCNGLKSDSKANRYHVILRNAHECVSPQPPYSKKRPIVAVFEIYASKGRSYIRGNTTIKSPSPFRNFSAQSFLQTSAGHREVKFQILNVSCRNFMAAALLNFSNISFTKKSCLLQRGFYPYFVDVDKITHSLPIWHERGRLVHHMQLEVGGATVMCAEIHVEVQSSP